MRRILALTAAIAVLIVGASPGFAQRDDLLQQVRERGVLRLCEAAYPPYNVKNPVSGAWEGFDVEIAKTIAGTLKVRIEDVDSSFPTLIASLNTGKCDLSVAATYVVPARAEQVLFTRPFAAETKTIFVKDGSSAHRYADIDKPGIIIATRAGTEEDVVAHRMFAHATVRALTSDATQPHLLEVAAGRADAAFAGYVGSMIFLKQNANMKLRPLGDQPVSASRFAFMLPKGEYFFQQYLNIVIDTMEADGEMQVLTAKYLPAMPDRQ